MCKQTTSCFSNKAKLPLYQPSQHSSQPFSSPPFVKKCSSEASCSQDFATACPWYGLSSSAPSYSELPMPTPLHSRFFSLSALRSPSSAGVRNPSGQASSFICSTTASPPWQLS